MPPKTVEETYQQFTQKEHILHRPDSYVGSIENSKQLQWIIEKDGSLAHREVTYPPALFKIFDEILVNAADNYQNSIEEKVNMTMLTVVFDHKTETISVQNDGKGIPIEIHKEAGIYVPQMIFGNLLTSSNYNDDDERTTGGRNGYGAKLTNIYSHDFSIEIVFGSKKYVQSWSNNMEVVNPPEITSVRSRKNSTTVTFRPDLSRFRDCSSFTDEIWAVFRRRVHDIAGCIPGLKVTLTEIGDDFPAEPLEIKYKTFTDYCKLYLNAQKRNTEAPITCVTHTQKGLNGKLVTWEVVVGPSYDQVEQQVSFVNNIATTAGGKHVTHVYDGLQKGLMPLVTKRIGSAAATLKPLDYKRSMFIFIRCLIINPEFTSQTKDFLNTNVSNFGGIRKKNDCVFPNKFIESILGTDVFSLLQEKTNAAESKALKKSDGAKTQRIYGIPKLTDANLAGTKHSKHCTLIVTEGDSAKALALAGVQSMRNISVPGMKDKPSGRDIYGVFPLRGKLLNVREASTSRVSNNEEIEAIKKIIGLKANCDYSQAANRDTLRYGHIMIMADQDHDGSHIKGLVINLFDYYWRDLLKCGYVLEFVTPILKAIRGKKKEIVRTFFTQPEYEEWKTTPEATANNWTIKYYKGLGTSTNRDAAEYFGDLLLHKKSFKYDAEAPPRLVLAFDPSQADERKSWLTDAPADVYLEQGRGIKDIRVTDFVDKELILYARANVNRAIPCVMDGLKPGQRKILYYMLKNKVNKDAKVSQLIGKIAADTSYHHGETSLATAIINMAQNFVGSNNLPFLVPEGQFGTRLMGGKDSASPRYIMTYLQPITRYLFPEHDDAILNYLEDDGTAVEPDFFAPVVPTVLVNGAEGIGTGWSTDIPTFSIDDSIELLLSYLTGRMDFDTATDLLSLPHWNHYKGSIQSAGHNSFSYEVNGTYEVKTIKDKVQLAITELPIKTWTQDYKEFLESLIEKKKTEEKPKAGATKVKILSFTEHHDEHHIRFEILMTKEMFDEASKAGIPKTFKLIGKANISNMTLIDHSGKVVRYESAKHILDNWFIPRLELYRQRKRYLIHSLLQEIIVKSSKAKFIQLVASGELVIAKRPLDEVKADMWHKFYILPHIDIIEKATGKNIRELVAEMSERSDAENYDAFSPLLEASDLNKGYADLLRLPISTLSKENAQKLIDDVDNTRAEWDRVSVTKESQMWLRDLVSLKLALKQMREQAEDAAVSLNINVDTLKDACFNEGWDDCLDNDELVSRAVKVSRPEISLTRRVVKKAAASRAKSARAAVTKDDSETSTVAPPPKKRRGGKAAAEIFEESEDSMDFSMLGSETEESLLDSFSE